MRRTHPYPSWILGNLIHYEIIDKRRNIRILGIAVNAVPGKLVQGSIHASIGAFYHFAISKRAGIQTELLYQGMGFNSKVLGNANFTYLNSPINFCYLLNKRLTVSAGPYVSLLFGKNLKTSSNPQGFSFVDYGFSFGGGVKIIKGLSAGLQYYFGLKNVENYYFIRTAENRVLQLYVSYQLTGKKSC
jgi:Outer membrane protein beta-barrel domain